MNFEDLKDYYCFGVAGNFANHLAEAGEGDEFSVIQTADKNAPKGLFPFYIPNHDTFLGEFPICHHSINHGGHDKLQVEAEVGLVCDFVYEDGKIVDLVPKEFCAFNDCSIRVQDGSKLSTKKNWGANSKGIATDFIKIDSFTEDGLLKDYFITSFIRRDGILYEYGTTCAVPSYSYFYTQLKDWIIEKLNTQPDCGPLEEINPLLKGIENSKGIFIAAGATAYADFGKRHYLEKEDEIFVYVYNGHVHSYQDIIDDMCGVGMHLGQCSKLHQTLD